MNDHQPTAGRLLKISEVERETSLHRATIYRRIAAGDFPAPMQISKRRVAWSMRAIESWKATRLDTP